MSDLNIILSASVIWKTQSFNLPWVYNGIMAACPQKLLVMVENCLMFVLTHARLSWDSESVDLNSLTSGLTKPKNLSYSLTFAARLFLLKLPIFLITPSLCIICLHVQCEFLETLLPAIFLIFLSRISPCLWLGEMSTVKKWFLVVVSISGAFSTCNKARKIINWNRCMGRAIVMISNTKRHYLFLDGLAFRFCGVMLINVRTHQLMTFSTNSLFDANRTISLLMPSVVAVGRWWPRCVKSSIEMTFIMMIALQILTQVLAPCYGN